MASLFPMFSRVAVHPSPTSVYIAKAFSRPPTTQLLGARNWHFSLPRRVSQSRTYHSTRPGVKESKNILFKAAGISIAGLGIGLSSLRTPKVYCDSPDKPLNVPGETAPPPQSSISLYELGFGTVAGLCAGVFVKKGAKAVAWFLGGIFVLLQYLGSASVVRVDWGRMGAKFENLFFTKNAAGDTRPPTVGSLWSWIVNFLTADFQPRASFIAGFVLGLRVG